MSTAETAPVRPRDAGTLILLRSRAGGTEVLIGRRAARTRFMPGFFVFPGGAVEPGDTHVNPASALHPAITVHARVAGRAPRARAIAIAAIRETLEETGLFVAAPGDVASSEPSWAGARAQRLAPDLARLDFVGRAITPAPNRIRFHARFFVARADHCHGRLAGNGELLDLHWAPVESVRRLQVARVTSYMLERAVRVAARPDDHRNASVLVSTRKGVKRVTVFVDEPH